MVKGGSRDLSSDALAILREIAVRGETAVRLDTDPEMALLRTIVDATVGIFAAEAASIALLDEASGNLRFVVAAGAQGQPVVGMTIGPTQGIAGYVFSTGESIAMADPAQDPRFGRNVADQTGYVPRSLLALPLEDGARTLGVLEVIDKRDGPFTIQDIETVTLFARQAATAIKVSARARDLRAVLADVLRSADDSASDAAVDELVSAATRRRSHDDRFWAFVDAIATMRHVSVSDRDLAIELLAVIGRHRTAGGRDSSGRLRSLRR
ncbi:MAG: GAF domain-containing protein [Thermomicrobiales bacterium]|nr:MAG: GAF domain-containing protein [Thermomicrobiales bacterium]